MIHKRQYAVGISVAIEWMTVWSAKKRRPAVESTHTVTQGINATLQLRRHDVHIAFSQLQLDGHRQLEICRWRYLHTLVDRKLPSTWACSQRQLAVDFDVKKRQYERLMNCKINTHKRSLWVDPNLVDPKDANAAGGIMDVYSAQPSTRRRLEQKMFSYLIYIIHSSNTKWIVSVDKAMVSVIMTWFISELTQLNHVTLFLMMSKSRLPTNWYRAANKRRLSHAAQH